MAEIKLGVCKRCNGEVEIINEEYTCKHCGFVVQNEELRKASERYYREVKKILEHGIELFDERLYEEAVTYFEMIFEDSAEAKFQLGKCYRSGFGVKQDKEKSEALCIKAAEEGSLSAMRFIAFLYERGIDWKKNYAKAVYWQEEIYKIEKNERSCVVMGRLYRQGGFGLEKNYAKSVEWSIRGLEIEKVCELFFCIGECHYEGGYGIEKNLKIAKKCYRAAVKIGGMYAIIAERRLRELGCTD